MVGVYYKFNNFHDIILRGYGTLLGVFYKILPVFTREITLRGLETLVRVIRKRLTRVQMRNTLTGVSNPPGGYFRFLDI